MENKLSFANYSPLEILQEQAGLTFTRYGVTDSLDLHDGRGSNVCISPISLRYDQISVGEPSDSDTYAVTLRLAQQTNSDLIRAIAFLQHATCMNIEHFCAEDLNALYPASDTGADYSLVCYFTKKATADVLLKAIEERSMANISLWVQGCKCRETRTRDRGVYLRIQVTAFGPRKQRGLSGYEFMHAGVVAADEEATRAGVSTRPDDEAKRNPDNTKTFYKKVEAKMAKRTMVEDTESGKQMSKRKR